MKYSVYNLEAKEISSIELDDTIFAEKINDHLIHLAVRSFMASMRSGSANTKTRGEVNISTRKMWNQKGTGRARHGAASSPTIRGGGVAFGPKPKKYVLKMTKKMRKAALKSALAARKDSIIVLENLEITEAKTKVVADIVKKFDVTDTKVTFVDVNENINFAKASGNIRRVSFLKPEDLNVYSIIDSKKLFMTVDAAKKLEEAVKVG